MKNLGFMPEPLDLADYPVRKFRSTYSSDSEYVKTTLEKFADLDPATPEDLEHLLEEAGVQSFVLKDKLLVPPTALPYGSKPAAKFFIVNFP